MTTPELEGSAAPKTPASRLIELQREIAYLKRDLAEAEAKASRAEERWAQYHRIGGVSYGGIPVAQYWCEFILWEALLNDCKFDAIIELGTWQGGFAWWLWGQSKARGIHFFTFDSIEPQHRMPPGPPDHFIRKDVFAESDWLIEHMRGWEPVILFCDNGNKPRELKTFGTALTHPDSLAVVHDWGDEIQPEEVPDSLEMVYREFCEELGSMSRVFKRRQK